MASLRIWRTAAAALLLVVLVTTATAATAGTTTPNRQPRAHYCKQVDAYRIRSCAKAILPTTPVGPQLAWVLDQFAGDAATLTEAEVRAHFSAEYFAVWGQQRSPEVLIGVLQGPSPSSVRSASLASPTRQGNGRRWRSCKTPRACELRSRSASPPPAQR
jgi:hypothetical protein